MEPKPLSYLDMVKKSKPPEQLIVYVEELLTKIRSENIRLIVIRGISGSGKTYLANILARNLNAIVCEADTFMFANGSSFNPKKLDTCHQMCKDRVKKTLKDGKIAIVSNTNTTLFELTQHVEIAYNEKLQSSQLIFIEPENEYRYDVEQCQKKCVHKVPVSTIRKQLENLKKCPTNGIVTTFDESGYEIRIANM